jgi:predicted TIM-barrel fold metal-dependent hydrolase
VPAYGLFRIEPLIGQLFDEHDSLAALEKAFVERMREAASDRRIICFKSVIAYRTGLDLEPLGGAEVSRAFDELKRGPEAQGLLARIHVPRSTRDDVKRLRDYLLWRALELSLEVELPFQIHTGMGDQDLDIETARPGLLAAVFRDEELRHARIILLHGAYPFYEEGAYLANVFPNVYLDLSEFNPLVVPSVRRVYTTILEMAPFTKVAYSSDAFGSPELQWVAGRKGRQALGSVLSEAVDADKLSSEAARTAARLIFADNARAIYGL